MNPTPSHTAISLVTLHAGYSHSSLALQSLAAFCHAEPFYPSISVHEYLVKVNLDRVLNDLVNLQPQLIGFSTYLWNIESTLRLVRLIKQLLPECCIVLGGPEAGPRGVELLNEYGEIDYVVNGEGEVAFRDLVRWELNQAGSLEQIAGLIWRGQEPHPIANPVSLIDMAELVSPFTLGLMPLDKPLIYWETSRGCPFICSFCTSCDERLRTMPMERLTEDLAVIARAGKKTVKLLDRSFHVGTQRTTDLLQQFVATPDGLRFHLELNPDHISEQAFEIFAQAPVGKFQFEIGLQTLNDGVLARIDRKMDVVLGLENIRRLVALKRHPIHLDLIAGLPGEDVASFNASLDRVFMLYADHLQLGTLKLLPGTPLQAQAETYGYIWDEAPPYEVLSNDALSFADMVRYKHYAELLERYWNSGLLRNTLRYLVETYYSNSVSSLFDTMTKFVSAAWFYEPQQPDALFSNLVAQQQENLQQDAVLKQLLLWDYANHSRVHGKTDPWIAEQLAVQRTSSGGGQSNKITCVSLSESTCEIINQSRRDALMPGRYGLSPQRHIKGGETHIVPLKGVEG